MAGGCWGQQKSLSKVQASVNDGTSLLVHSSLMLRPWELSW